MRDIMPFIYMYARRQFPKRKTLSSTQNLCIKLVKQYPAVDHLSPVKHQSTVFSLCEAEPKVSTMQLCEHSYNSYYNLHPIAWSTVPQALERRLSAARHLLFILITFSLI
jgi:hypothetical protein